LKQIQTDIIRMPHSITSQKSQKPPDFLRTVSFRMRALIKKHATMDYYRPAQKSCTQAGSKRAIGLSAVDRYPTRQRFFARQFSFSLGIALVSTSYS